jgi:hypothetical protein
MQDEHQNIFEIQLSCTNIDIVPKQKNVLYILKQCFVTKMLGAIAKEACVWFGVYLIMSIALIR